jgi:hypothetical protein
MLTRLAELLLFGIIPYLVGSFAASSADIVDRDMAATPIVQVLDDDAIDGGDEAAGPDSSAKR